jgi:APA family basic amino acid/polyamine antiporter
MAFSSVRSQAFPGFETPHISLLVSGAWSAIFALSGSYTQLVSFATFIFWIQYGIGVAGVVALRRSRPNQPRPYRMTGYPITPILFCLAAGAVATFTFFSAPLTSAIGVFVFLTGFPAYYVIRKVSSAERPMPLK